MKNIICIVILMFATGLYAQSTIETNELYLKYEKEYINLTTSDYVTKYEEANREFQMRFDNKRKGSFQKSKNKERWL